MVALTSAEDAAAVKTAIVVGIDESGLSFYALRRALLLFFSGRGPNPPVKLVVVYAKPIPTSVVSVAGPGAADVLITVESDLRMTAARVMKKAKDICTASSVADVEYEVVEGDPKNVLCKTVEKHTADVLVLGSHGHGAIKSI